MVQRGQRHRGSVVMGPHSRGIHMSTEGAASELRVGLHMVHTPPDNSTQIGFEAARLRHQLITSESLDTTGTHIPGEAV